MNVKPIPLAIIALLLVTSCQSLSAQEQAEPRPKAPHKLLYNNDTTNTAGKPSPFHTQGEPFTEAKLVASIVEVAGKGVDAYMLSPGLGWVPWWQSKVEPDYYEWWMKRTGIKEIGGRHGRISNKSGREYEKYVYNGGDMVQVLIDTCRKHNMAPFVSLRLNDVHEQDTYRENTTLSLLSSRFYVENPQWHIDPEHYKRKGYYGKRGMDWAVPQVPEQKLKLLRELADNYDLAGLELDFLRHSQFFRDNGPPAEKRIEIMTAFVSEVRKALDRKEGKRRWLCVRIPARLSAHPELGLDLRELYRAGVDMFNLSDWYHTTQGSDIDKARKLLPNAAIYTELTYTAGSNRTHSHAGKTRHINPRTSDPMFYTTARIAYDKGADGVSLFNFVYYRWFLKDVVEYQEPPFHVLPKLTDRDFLNKQPPHYYLAERAYEKQLAKTLNKGRSQRFGMDMLTTDKNATLRLLVHCKEIVGDRKLAAKLNGTALKPVADVSALYHYPYETMITPNGKHRRAFEIPGALIRNGLNDVELKLENGEPLTVIWLDAGILEHSKQQKK